MQRTEFHEYLQELNHKSGISTLYPRVLLT
jgi:hypothetical protein